MAPRRRVRSCPHRRPALLPALRRRDGRRGTAHFRGELVRWLRRLGEPVTAFPGCPPEFAAGIDGDWRAAAAEWERIGDPYERALELWSRWVAADIGCRSRCSTVSAPGLQRRWPGAGCGSSASPRSARPARRPRDNPAGLTERQVEILRLLASGMTNAEIAARLVVSVRTVDHHVSAVLQKLGVATRREAAAAVATLGLR